MYARSLIEASLDPLVTIGADGAIMDVNRATEKVTGVARGQLIGSDFSSYFIEPEKAREGYRKVFSEGVVTDYPLAIRHRDGSVTDVLYNASVYHDEAGGVAGVFAAARDVTQRKRSELEQVKLNRALRALSACNHELVYARDEPQLLQSMCRVIVELGGYRMAWVGYLGDDAEKSIRPVAQNGFEEGYLESAHISWADTERGRGPTGRAARSGQIQIAQNILTDPSLLPWRAEASKRGYASSIALPFLHEGKVFGVLTIYAAQADAFSQDEVGLLQEMAEDLAFGVQTLRLRQEQRRITEQLRKGLEDTVQVVSAMVEMRDPYTAGHERRVAELAAAIAMEMGLQEEQVHGLHLAGTIHDLGKIQVPAEILSKPGRLTSVEFSLIKTHSQTGYDILKNIEFPWPIAQMVLQHHERMDGSGYPQGLKGDAILPEARILAVADVVEAMASHRPYRPGLGVSAALDEIVKNRGVFYDPDVVDACVRLFKEKNYTLVEVLEKR